MFGLSDEERAGRAGGGGAARTMDRSRPVEEHLFGLTYLILVVALLEALHAILDLPLIIDRPNLLFGPWAVMPATLTGIILAKARVVLHPLLALAALTLCLSGNLRGALVALGAIWVMTWLSFLPWVLHDGLPIQGWWALQWTVAQLFVFPVLAAAAIALAVLSSRHRLAAVLLAIPTAYAAFGTAMFIVKAVVANR
jgi:hypothetical protein